MDQERAASAQLRSQVEQDKIRNAELEKQISNERNTVSDLQRAAEIDEEKIRDLISSLENERKELKNIRLVVELLANVSGFLLLKKCAIGKIGRKLTKSAFVVIACVSLDRWL